VIVIGIINLLGQIIDKSKAKARGGGGGGGRRDGMMMMMMMLSLLYTLYSYNIHPCSLVTNKL